MKNGNRSGDPAIDRNAAYYRRTWKETIDKTFRQTVFHPCPALVQKELVNGHRMWQPYEDGDYDKAKYDVVEDMWDHEHCSICNFRIIAGHTYWLNERRVRLLCDECYDHFTSHTETGEVKSSSFDFPETYHEAQGRQPACGAARRESVC